MTIDFDSILSQITQASRTSRQFDRDQIAVIEVLKLNTGRSFLAQKKRIMETNQTVIWRGDLYRSIVSILISFFLRFVASQNLYHKIF